MLDEAYSLSKHNLAGARTTLVIWRGTIGWFSGVAGGVTSDSKVLGKEEGEDAARLNSERRFLRTG